MGTIQNTTMSEIQNLKFTKEMLKTVEKLTSNILKDLETSIANQKTLQTTSSKVINNAENVK